MLCLFSYLSVGYVKSQFGFPGTDTVMSQEGDSFEVLEPNLPIPTKIKNIRESHDFAKPQITSDDQYPWPGHNYKCSDASINSEKQAMMNKFCRAYKPNELTQDQLFYHPAGILQFTRNKTFIKEIKKAPRIKLRMFINSRIHTAHWTSVYAMPGELITIEIPKFLVNKASIKLNHQAEESHGTIRWRLPAARCGFDLKHEKSVFGWPIGGAISITVWGDSFNEGIEVNISGGIRMPHFRYGVNSDKEWEEELREYKAPLAVVDPGNILELFPADHSRRQVKLNDACAFWRTVSKIFLSFNNVTGHHKRSDGRSKTQIQFNFDDYIRYGAAFAMIPANYIQAPPGWSDNMMNYDSMKWGCWGNVHEYGHHFQYWWGTPGTGETTNNAANFITYALITEIDSSRQTDMKGVYWVDGGGWNWVTHEYSTYDFRNGYNGPLVFYGNMVYWFGHIKWRETLFRHIERKDFPRNPRFSYVAEFLLTCSKNFKRDMRPYFATFQFFDMKKEINDEANKLLNEWKLPEFHPVTNLYAVGFKYDDREEFETHKPYAIGARSPYYFDFEKTKRTRTGMHQFKCIGVRGGEGKFEKIGDGEGKYKYTPPSNISVIDKFYVQYQDQQNKSSITEVIVKVRQIVKGCRTSFMALPKGTYKTAYAAEKAYYENLQTGKIIPTIMRVNGGIKVPRINAHDQFLPWVAVTEGVFIPKNTSKYKFTFKYYFHMAFYLTEETLTGDPDKDSKYLLKNFTEGGTHKYENSKATKEIELTAGKRYNFKFVVVGIKNGGWGEVGVSFNKGPFQSVNGKMIYYPECSDEDRETWKFIPRIEQDPTYGKYYDNLHVPLDRSIIKVIQAPEPDDKKFDWKTMLLNGKKEANSKSSNKSFPYVYGIDFGKPQSFNVFMAHFADKAKMDSNISFFCDGKNTVNKTFKKAGDDLIAKKFHTCQKVEIKVMSNTFGNYSSFNDFTIQLTTNIISTRNIIPATHTGFSVNDKNKCKLTSAGLYYNGKGWHLESGCSLNISIVFNETGKEVGVIGDKSHLNGGVFDFFIDGKNASTVNTSQGISRNEYMNTYYSMYQQLLTGIRGLANGTEHNFEIRVRSGKVRIAGLLANTNNSKPQDPSSIDGDQNEDQKDDQNQNKPDLNNEGDKNKITTQYVVALFISALTGFVVLVYAGFVVYKKWIESHNDDESL